MLISDFFPELDEGRVRQLRDVSAAIGHAYHKAMGRGERDYSQNAGVIAATYLRCAAANSILLDEFRQSAEFFAEAARLYDHAGSPYGTLMDALAGQYMADSPRHNFGTSAQSVYVLVSALGDERAVPPEYLLQLRKELDEFRGTRTGVLAIAIDHYLDLFDALHNMIDAEARLSLLREALLPFVHSYSVALRRARRDKFHWTRLAMVFHPVEPDIIGMFVIVANALTRARIDYRIMLEGFPVDREAMAILTYCVKKMGRSHNK
jgi:hypothetical protein